jgi:hypothetical protein
MLMRDRYNAAVISAQPRNAYTWSVVSPSFLLGGQFDILATNASIANRATMRGWGFRGKDYTLGDLQWPYGSIVDNPVMNFSNTINDMQARVVKGEAELVKLTTMQCLMQYLQLQGNASDLILVSSVDTLNNTSPVTSNSSNSLLVCGYQGSSYAPSTAWPTWECGLSNSFNCRNPSSWSTNQSMISNWNILGYRIDYCLSKQQSLGDKCSVTIKWPIMIGTVSPTARESKTLC